MAQTCALLLLTEIAAQSGKSAKISFVAQSRCNFYLKITIFCSHGNRKNSDAIIYCLKVVNNLPFYLVKCVLQVCLMRISSQEKLE